jgi:hypothetical protein
MKILIEVQCYNRKAITEIVLNQIVKYKNGCDLRIVNDYSTEYDNDWLSKFSDDIIIYEKKLSINILKYRSFKSFLETDYTHFYMCDNDAFHDINFVDELKYLSQYNLPISLYRSSFIHSFGDGVHKYIHRFKDFSIKEGLFGGISVFLNRDHVKNIVDKLGSEEAWVESCVKNAWDSRIQSMISENRRYIIPNKSFVEHFGLNGQNHKSKTSDCALEPTEYLKNYSDEIWAKLELEYGK